MRVETTADPRQFLIVAGGFLLADPVVNSVLLTVTSALASGPDTDPTTSDGYRPLWAVVYSSTGDPVGAAMRTSTMRGIALSRLPDGAAGVLTDQLPRDFHDARRVSGPADDAAIFAAAWAGRTRQVAHLWMRQRMHELDTVRHPEPVAGRYRLAGSADCELVARWADAFEREEGLGGAADDLSEPSARMKAHVAAQIDAGDVHLWDNDGPVSYAATRPAQGGVVRIGPVYTPPECRRNGYATALTAAASQAALDAGADRCALYTDLANPTSNKIYAAIGYRSVCDAAVYDLSTE